MRHLLPAILLVAAACDTPAAPPSPAPNPAPDRVTVRHILISFKGTRTKATRSMEEAKVLAGQLLDVVKKGEDFAALMKAHSDDTGPGVYTMANHGTPGSPPAVYPRSQMAKAFGDVAFSLDVNGIGMADFDPARSPFGWHIIQRIR
jgi:parvulin-like peptidyl-prolyl isomerase